MTIYKLCKLEGNLWTLMFSDLANGVFGPLKPLHNIGKIEKQKCSQIYMKLIQFEDGYSRNLALKYFCLKCCILGEISKRNSLRLTEI